MKSNERPDPFPKPDFIFAGKNKNHSHRPVITITPLAKALKLEVNATFGTDEPKKLAEELLSSPKYAGKTILIYWRHTTMPDLAISLKVKNAPKEWKETVFDRVWDIVLQDGTGTLTNRPQNLLVGDSK